MPRRKGDPLNQPAVQEIVLSVIRQTRSIEVAAKLMGFSKVSIYELAKRDPKFKAAKGEALGSKLEQIEEATLRDALDGDVRGSHILKIFMLKNLLGWRDEVEQVQKATVVLRFDAQDAEA